MEEQFGADAYTALQFKQYMKTAKVFLVLKYEEKTIGYAILHYRKNSSVGMLYSICIDKDFQGKAFGRYLLFNVEAYCKHHGLKKIKIECSENNEKAMRFYENLGYKTIGLAPDYYADGSSAFLMSKCISRS